MRYVSESPTVTPDPGVGVSTLPDPSNYTAWRTIRALELVSWRPISALALADALKVDARTARRLVSVLVSEQYAERRTGRGRRQRYVGTVRLLALAAQLARRLPLVEHGERAVHQLHERTGLTACLVVPSYADVLVLARAGSGRPWACELLPAAETAAGRVLLAYRHSWRQSLADGNMEKTAEAIRAHGYELDGRRGADSPRWLAAPVGHVRPVAALALVGAGAPVDADEARLISQLLDCARTLSQRCPSGDGSA